jgi:LuxR family maltose regulon positive regulatory protein
VVLKQAETQEAKPKRPRGLKIIERPRLIKRLEEAKCDTILLIAPAGYGKTTLLRQWRERHPELLWYSAHLGSADVAQLAADLSAVLEPASPGIHDHVTEVVRALTNPARQLGDVIEAFSARWASPRATLAIDDYHLLAGTGMGASDELVSGLRRSLGIGLVVGSRVRPSWARARDAVYGLTDEVGLEELAMSQSETSEMLAGTAPALTKRLLAQAHGWPAVIGLAALSQAPDRAPHDAVSATLFSFFAEELFDTAPPTLQEHLPALALLPTLSPELACRLLGPSARTSVKAALDRGFATSTDSEPAMHPLVREFLFSKLNLQPDPHKVIEDAVVMSLEATAWDHALSLLGRFTRFDLVDSLIATAFQPLAEAGRSATLEQITAFARKHAVDFSPFVLLIDAELALREGLFNRAEALGTRAASTLPLDHPLTAHAYWLAGQAAQLASRHDDARSHFLNAHDAAADTALERESLVGLLMTYACSEDPAHATEALGAVEKLHAMRDQSPTHFVRATTARIFYRRYTVGVAKSLDVEMAMHALPAVPDPKIRTAFTNTYSYELILRAEYDAAHAVATMTRDDAVAHGLTWARPHAEWGLAAASLGMRDFSSADKWLKRVERTASALEDGHLILNAATLRARMLVALHQTRDAYEALSIDDSRPANPAMKAELVATRALVDGLRENRAGAARQLERALAMSASVEVRCLAACADAVAVRTPRAYRAAFELSEALGVWDALICAMRAYPPFLVNLSRLEALRPRLQHLLRLSHDYDLARHAAIELGAPERNRRDSLTGREVEVLRLVRQGLTNREIAELLFVSPSTVKVHLRNIFVKIGAHTRTEAANYILDDEG